tara:strand:+ start:2478 stop:3566 length:1089 start_codon:yes stop_codon:yes gene_type:complete
VKHLLVVLTNNRVNEKIRCIIPELSNHYKLSLYNIGEMSNHTKWYGDLDPRIKFQEETYKYFDEIIDGEGLKFHGDTIDNILSYVSLKEYDGILYDDNRIMSEFKIPDLYKESKKFDIPMIGNSHGNRDFKPEELDGLGKSFDYTFILGEKERLIYKQVCDENKLLKGGIPSNDSLKNVNVGSEHILVITNFLGNHPAGSSLYSNPFNQEFVDKVDLVGLSKYFEKPIVIKQKTRLDDPDYNKNISYIENLFPKDVDINVVTDVDDMDRLICDSYCIVSAISTLCFKPIQKGIPISIVKDTGMVGNFYDSNSLCELDKYSIYESIEWQMEHDKDKEFIETTIEGGLEFNSTEKYIDKIREII